MQISRRGLWKRPKNYATTTSLITSSCVLVLCPSYLSDVCYQLRLSGQSMPGMFLDQDVREFQSGMNLNYFGTLYTCKVIIVIFLVLSTHVEWIECIQAAAQLMVEHKVSGRLVIMYIQMYTCLSLDSNTSFHSSSVVGLFGLVGYSQYAPTKFALRGMHVNYWTTMLLILSSRSGRNIEPRTARIWYQSAYYVPRHHFYPWYVVIDVDVWYHVLIATCRFLCGGLNTMFKLDSFWWFKCQ